jgi:hypothetical protein
VTISDPQMVLNTKPPESKKDQSQTKDVAKNAAPNAANPKAAAEKLNGNGPERDAPPPNAKVPPAPRPE